MKSFSRLPVISLIIIQASFAALGILIPSATAQDSKSVPSESELRNRLRQLKLELAEECDTISDATQGLEEALTERKKTAHDLATRLLENRIELERLKRLKPKTTQPPEVGNDLLSQTKLAAEQLDLFLKEHPNNESDARLSKQTLKVLSSDYLTEDSESFLDQFKIILDLIDQAHSRGTNVRVAQTPIRTADGLIEEVRLLSMGNVAFAYETLNKNRYGLMVSSPSDASGFRWTENLGNSVIQQLRESIEKIEKHHSGSVIIPMDVTGRIRKESLLQNESWKDRIHSGGPVMVPLGVLALLAILLLAERFWWLYFRNANQTQVVHQVMDLCEKKQFEKAQEILDRADEIVTRTLSACLRIHQQGIKAMEDSIQEQLLHELPRLRRFLSGLGILAAVAPLLGLLGTVTGIIQVFSTIRLFGNTNPGFMAGGISEALVTTVTGLLIAIPILLLRGMLQGRMEKIVADAERHAATLLNSLAHRR